MKNNFYRKSKSWIAVITSAILLVTVSVPPQGEAKTYLTTPQDEAKKVNEKFENTEIVENSGSVSEKYYYVCAPATIPKELCETEDVPQELCAQNKAAYRDGLASYICYVNSSISEDTAADLVDSIMESSEKYDVDETLVMAIAQTESCYESDAVSSVGCKGVMQTGDVLAEESGYDGSQLFDPAVSIEVGTSYIKDKLDEFGDVILALTAYNQGSGTVYSGNYDLDYADLTISRMDEIEEYIDDYDLQ